ncbi:unnamed protein product [Protopolystoma xenopodis]|uniref:RyR/IP3R Homology associated domain-containing protein n=1 Tax=Protopolystoma xenopodis TaxID=117903 RepID=A0A3S5A1X0_9PLAT|nr:unnamed protein product [Protopolystoma xenopodis]
MVPFQDYLRSQAGNTISVNLIISTVDYLLRLQESIMDFYWHYSNKDTIDDAGKRNFVRAIKIGKQVFCSLTEYIQGPCLGNQLALAHSRLWDAISGFLYLFAHMQDKLSKDPDQLDLLREFLNLQKEMMIMLLSMLEGNVVNGPIGRQMVDTLAESAANVEVSLGLLAKGLIHFVCVLKHVLFYLLNRIFVLTLISSPFDHFLTNSLF